MKNKALSVFLLVCILSGLFSFGAGAVELGDIDADGKVSSQDARTALRYSVGLEQLTPDQVFRADVDSDGGIYSSDARTILRISVGLTPGRYIKSQYDMIRCGIFNYSGERLDSETGLYEYYELARTYDSVHLLTTFDGVEIAVFIKNNTVYTVSHQKRMYLITPDEVFTTIGADKNELLKGTELSGADYPPLTKAYSEKSGMVEGYQCRIYLIKNGSNTLEVAMCGDKLVRIREFDSYNKLVDVIVFYNISMTVPSHKKDIPAGYKKYEGKLQALSFVAELLKK